MHLYVHWMCFMLDDFFSHQDGCELMLFLFGEAKSLCKLFY